MKQQHAKFALYVIDGHSEAEWLLKVEKKKI